MNKKQQKQQLQQITMKLNQGLNGVYFVEFRRAQLLKAYDSINDLISSSKDSAPEWYSLRTATRDTIINFNSRSSLIKATRELEEALHE